MEQQLVSFGNYLLKKCNVKAHGIDGESYAIRQVTDADMRNWECEYQGKYDTPSQFQIGDQVYLSLASNFNQEKDKKQAEDYSAWVMAVHFYNHKVKYDLELRFPDETATRIYNIDCCFVWQVPVSETKFNGLKFATEENLP